MKIENSAYPEHHLNGKQENIQELNQQNLPSVYITLAELHQNVPKLLQEHSNLIPVTSFIHCYEKSFGPFKKANCGNPREGEDRDITYVPLEYLIASIPGVTIESPMNGIRVVKLSLDPPKEDVIGAPSNEAMRQLRHEIVDLVKQQPKFCLLLSNFIPMYHSRFNKQFRVSNYGYTRLEDLFESLKNVVHIVGQGPHRTIMLTHLTQVRRFTHELLRILKTQQRKCLRTDEIPKIYKAVYNKELQLSNYGVCTINDLLNDIPENKLIVKDIKDVGDPALEYSLVMIPQRVQTVEQKIRTNLFALEAIDILSSSQSFRILFTKFIPAYHHTFNRQCRVADYGFTKFIELLEAIPQTVEVFVENGERYINLTLPLRLSLTRQMLLEVLQSQSGHRILLNDLVTAFYAKYQLTLLSQDCGFGTLEEMLSSFSDILFLSKVKQQKCDNESTSKESMTDDSSPEVDEPEKSNSETNKTFVILVDRSEAKQTAYRCLKLLLNSPFGWIPENEFRDSFRAHYNEEIDLELVNREMSPFILVREYATQNTFRTDMEVNPQSSRIVQPCPLILLAQQIRLVLTNVRGRLLINFLEEMYRSNFGVELYPGVYGYPSTITLINALKFAVTTRGRGSRTTILLAPNFLGKLAWMVAYKILFRHNLIEQFQNEPADLLKPTVNPPNICLQSIGNILPWNYPPDPESQPVDPDNHFPPLFPEPVHIRQGFNYLNLSPVDYVSQMYLNNVPFYQEQGMALVSPFTYPMATASNQTQSPLAKLTATSTVEPQLCSEIQAFFEAANTDHLQLSKRTIRRICNLLTKKLISQSSAIRGLHILRTALRQMQKSSKHLTSLHVNICQLAISAKFFSPVIPILNEDILDVDTNKQAYCILDTFLYFYYGGVVYAAVKMWERSYNFFSLACSLPNSWFSPVTYSAAKKLILVSLIYKGEFNRTDCKVFSRIKDQLDPYTRLEVAFASQNTSSLQSLIADNRTTFEQDKNLGLVEQLVDCHIKCRIQSLTETYFSLSMNDFVTLAGFDSPTTAEQKLIELAASESIFVKVDHKSGCVRFLDNSERYESPEVLSTLIQKMRDTMNYDRLLRQINSEEGARSPNTESTPGSSVATVIPKRRPAVH
nr:limkain b1 [Hymenolepis microstoma]